MVSALFILVLLLINFNKLLSIKIGKIEHLSVKNNLIYQTSNKNCTACLCDCLQSSSTISSCSGINCFPSNQSCQLIEQRAWIFESDILINLTANNFIAIKENNTRLCSCYTPKKILDFYGQINITDISTTNNIRSIKYIPNDDTLIVLNPTLIRKLSAKNFNIILRNISLTTDVAVSILHNDSKIYIAFTFNRSINMFDLNLTFIKTSTSWSRQAEVFAGMFLWNNHILIIDAGRLVIWLIDSLDQDNLTLFFNFSSYNIQLPTGLFIYQNQSLYISSVSQQLYVFNLNNFTLNTIISLPLNISMLFMRYDSNCNRLWFGTQNYTYAPVLDLATNQMNIYQTKGIISKFGIYSIDFNLQYTAFFSDTNGNLRQISLLNNIQC